MTVSTLRIVVAGLLLVLLTCVVGIVALSMANPARTIPDVLQNIAVGTLTGLVGLLVPTRSNDVPSPPRGDRGAADAGVALLVGALVLVIVWAITHLALLLWLAVVLVVVGVVVLVVQRTPRQRL